MANLKSETTCDLCGRRDPALRYRLGSIEVVQCPGCGLVFVHPATRASERALYDAEYFRERSEYFRPSAADSGPLPRGEHIESFRLGLEILGRHKSPRGDGCSAAGMPGAQGRLLDLGCAVGVFLRLAEAAGWDACGVDVSPYATAVARKHCRGEIFTGSLEAVGFPDASFDVVTLWDVVEHLDRPRETLREVRRILRTDGLMLVDTPNEDCLMRRVAHELYRWSGGRFSYPVRKLYHAYHQYYFSERTLRMLLDGCGFEVTALLRKSIPREKGRGSPLERSLVKLFGLLERPLGMDFELMALACKKTRDEAE
ncbi:MAG: class I SAM-dependent methyltransferase [bacterium]